MRRDDRRSTLEAIAYGDDPELRPADRLKALEQLRELPDVESRDVCPSCQLAADTPDDVLDRRLDQHVADDVAAALTDPERFPYPETIATVEREVERRVAEDAEDERGRGRVRASRRGAPVSWASRSPRSERLDSRGVVPRPRATGR